MRGRGVRGGRCPWRQRLPAPARGPGPVSLRAALRAPSGVRGGVRPGGDRGAPHGKRGQPVSPAPAGVARLRAAHSELWSPEVLAFPGGPEQVAGVGGGLLDWSGAADRGSAPGWLCLSNW